MLRRSLLTVLAILLLHRAAAVAVDQEARRLLDQVRQVSDTTRKWTDRTQRLKIRIIDRRGGERLRDLMIYLKKYAEDRTRTIVFFESPPDVKGVGFLQWADPHAKDQQWLYVPELKRVRQISGGAKRESFVGTDFSFNDLAIIGQITEWSEADAPATLLRDETVEGRSCHVIEFTPGTKDFGYGKVVIWLRADDLVIVKYSMHDTAGRQEKVLTLGDVRPVGQIPTPFTMEMKNIDSGSHTVVDFTEIKYDTHLGDDLFTQRALEHGL
ncbi:MAG TPA: outer membrane lipoprotein-sorting protein [Candidatus Margulisiibacteriota bacterium]|nr:outer membrane lipoprotein-sorting protein [Candidatus Margulisiibacteriota bacterium]